MLHLDILPSPHASRYLCDIDFSHWLGFSCWLHDGPPPVIHQEETMALCATVRTNQEPWMLGRWDWLYCLMVCWCRHPKTVWIEVMGEDWIDFALTGLLLFTINKFGLEINIVSTRNQNHFKDSWIWISWMFLESTGAQKNHIESFEYFIPWMSCIHSEMPVATLKINKRLFLRYIESFIFNVATGLLSTFHSIYNLAKEPCRTQKSCLEALYHQGFQTSPSMTCHRTMPPTAWWQPS